MKSSVGTDTSPRDAIMLIRNNQANCQDCCTLCTRRARYAKVSSVCNQENYTKRVAHDNKNPKSKLNPEEFHDRSQNIRNKEKRLTNVDAKLVLLPSLPWTSQISYEAAASLVHEQYV